MKTEIEEYLAATFSDKEYHKRPWITCKDGAGVSVQACEGMYCAPRVSGLRYYDKVECGFPSVVPPDSWKEYAEEWSANKFKVFKRWARAVLKEKYPTLKRIYWAQLTRPLSTQTIYPYMPVDVVQDYLDAHGGIDWEKTMARKDEMK